MAFPLFSPSPQQPQNLFQPQQTQNLFQPQQTQQPFQQNNQFLQQHQPQQQHQQQQQQQFYLFTTEKSPANYQTKWSELHPDSQKVLLQIEDRILEYRDESQRLDQSSRLYDTSVSNDGFELDANHVVQELGGINTAMEREKVSLQELMSVVKGMMRDTEVAVRSYMMLCPRFLHAGPPAASNVNPPGQFSGTMALSNTASQPKATSIVPLFDFYSGVPRRPSPFLQHTTARFEKYLAECRQWIEELEQLFRLDSDENGRSGSDMALLNSLPAVMSNLHDFFVHVAAKLENLHQQVESMRSAYLADQKRRGDANDPFLEADRREMAKQEAAARRVHPTLHMPGFSQPSTQIVGLFASSAMPGASVALQSSVGSSASSSASVFPSFNTPSSSSTAASTSPSLFATPFAATPASNLFGPSVSSQPSSFFGASTPSLGSSPAVGSTSFLSMPSFATGVGTGSGASFGAASKSAKPKSRTARR